ncbi:MAG: CBS domain-containing protein [Nannocystaceae bacterium]|nr:CBS domain-containing protein [bacterium]
MTVEPPLIREFMTPDPYAIEQSLTISDASDRMRAHNIGHLIVLDKEELRGVVTRSDLHLALALSNDSAADTLVADAVRPAMTCSPFSYLASVLRDMDQRRLDNVVVLDHGSDVVGIFTLVDAARAARSLANNYAAAPEQEVDRGSVPPERERTLPKVRVKRMLGRAHAAPRHANGLVMGEVMA